MRSLTLAAMIVAAMTAVVVWPIAAQQKPPSAEAQLQAAITTETVAGELKAAIDAYRGIVASFRTTEPAVAARALLRMGQCYEKLGDSEARKAYEQLLRDFAGQKEVADQARARLAALNPKAAGTTAGTTRRQLWTTPLASTHTYPLRVSPDGRYIAYGDWSKEGAGGNIVLHDLVRGTDRLLTTTATRDDFGEAAVFSQDGRQLAYTWYDGSANRCELRLVDISETGVPPSRRLATAEGISGWITGYDWSPDGKWIAAVVSRPDHTHQVGLFSTVDGAFRTIRSGLPEGTRSVAVSPDGRYLAFDVPVPPAPAKDIIIATLDGGQEIGGIVYKGDDSLVGWTPDGTRVLFTSDRSGELALWAQPFANGRLQGASEIVRADLGKLEFLGLGSSGALYTSVNNSRRAGTELLVGSFDFSTGTWLAPPVDAALESRPGSPLFPSLQPSPDWSPDGRYFTYLAGGPLDNMITPNPTFVVRSMDTQEVRVLKPKVAALLGMQMWSPDGRSIVGAGRDADGRFAIWRVDAATGDSERVAWGGEAGETVTYFLGWAATGMRVRFVRVVPGTDGYSIATWEKDLLSGEERELARTDTALGVAGVSPDGERVYHRKKLAAGETGAAAISALVERHLTSGAERELLRRPFAGAMRLSPDGRLIAAASNDTAAGTATILLVPVAAADPREVMRARLDPKAKNGPAPTSEPLGVLYWSWSPDSQSFLVRKKAADGERPETWWVPVDGRAPKKVDIPGAGDLAITRVHPDGKRMALALTNLGPSKPSEVWVLENFLPPAKPPAPVASAKK